MWVRVFVIAGGVWLVVEGEFSEELAADDASHGSQASPGLPGSSVAKMILHDPAPNRRERRRPAQSVRVDETAATAAVRDWTASRWKMFSRCLRTVPGEIVRARAISVLE